MRCSRCGCDGPNILVGGVCYPCVVDQQRKATYAGDVDLTWYVHNKTAKAVKPLEYLAAPYTHEDPAVRLERFDSINRAAATLFLAGRHIYSPMSHTLPIALAGGIAPSFEFWREYDHRMLCLCDRLLVLMLKGWELSKGVDQEIHWAIELGMPIEYMEVK